MLAGMNPWAPTSSSCPNPTTHPTTHPLHSVIVYQRFPHSEPTRKIINQTLSFRASEGRLSNKKRHITHTCTHAHTHNVWSYAGILTKTHTHSETHTNVHTHTHTHTHTHRPLFVHTQTLHPLRPPLHLPPGPPGSHGDGWSEVSGWGGVGSRAEPPACSLYPLGPVCTHAHTHTDTHTSSPPWQGYSLTQPVSLLIYKPPFQPFLSLHSFSSCLHLPPFTSSLPVWCYIH